MMTAPLRRLHAVRPLSGFRLEVEWQDDLPMTINMEDLALEEGTIFSPLRDTDLFATVRIGERARTIEWPDPVNPGDIVADYCADALYLRGQRQGMMTRTLQDIMNLRRITEKPST